MDVGAGRPSASRSRRAEEVAGVPLADHAGAAGYGAVTPDVTPAPGEAARTPFLA
ncbi:hypothetical protein JOE37_000352 [Clavibacter michiganensis]|nr:hypothetical protein [Clavibacter michiganensis]